MTGWTLREAACVIHCFDPSDTTIVIKAKSSDPVSVLHAHLKSKGQQSKLYSYDTDNDGNPLFRPGTVIRFVHDKCKHVAKVHTAVLKCWKADASHAGVTISEKQHRELWRNYAKLIGKSILKSAPKATLLSVATRVEEVLNHFGYFDLSRDAIRQLIRDPKNKRSAGRPKKGDPVKLPYLKHLIVKHPMPEMPA